MNTLGAGVRAAIARSETKSVGAPEGIRTPNLLIRSQMLYPLSYGRSAIRPVADVTGRVRRAPKRSEARARRRPGGQLGVSLLDTSMLGFLTSTFASPPK